MNLLLWSAMGLLALNVILLLFLLLRSRPPETYVLTLMPELRLGKPIITPNELREIAWESWSSAHPDASPIEKDRARWVIEKEAHRLEKRNRQHLTGTQKPTMTANFHPNSFVYDPPEGFSSDE